MEPTTRKRGSRVLLLVLASSALASLASGALLVLDRLGYVELRRVPNLELHAWKENGGAAVAIFNTDTIGGSYRLGFHNGSKQGKEAARGTAKPIWVPPRSVILRADPQSIGAMIRHGRLPPLDETVWSPDRVDTPGILVERGHPVRVELLPGTAFVELNDYRGVFAVERVGDVLSLKRSPGPVSPREPVELFSPPPSLSLDTTHAEPGALLLRVFMGSAQWTKEFETRFLQIVLYEPDMTVIDERALPPGE